MKLSEIILQYPHELLATSCNKVTDMQEAGRIAKKLFETAHVIRNNVYSYPRGIEIAAPQIGELFRIIIVIGPKGNEWKKVMINPEILSLSESVMNWEDCLSIEGMRAMVKRYRVCNVRYQNLYGTWHEERCFDNEAFDVQHGIDHLNGQLYFEREMCYFIPLSVYRPLKDQGIDILNKYVESHYERLNTVNNNIKTILENV